jgi:putative transposase
LQNINDRIDKAYVNFFRRLKEKQAGKKIKLGYPRFKNKYKSFTYPQSGFTLDGNKLHLSKIGKVNVCIGKKQNRVSGKMKTLTIKREPSGKWFAIFSCIDVPVKKLKPNKREIGIDVGLEYFATLSNDKKIDNPRFLFHSEQKLNVLQRRLSRKKLHGKNWQKASHKVALLHEHIANQRYDFHHQLTHKLIIEYGTICYEDLNIKGMVKHPYLAKHIHDASWGQFTRLLKCKAESAGRIAKAIDPRGTSQTCSQCRNKVPKTLAQRWHRCPHCGIKLHRDLNSAKEILTRGTLEKYACGDRSSALFAQSNFEHSLSRKQEIPQLIGG